jgi:hypothetical protein
MCCQFTDQPERCAITVGRNDEQSIRYLSTGEDNEDSYPYIDPNFQLNENLFNVAMELQNNVFVVLPAFPGAFLALGVILLMVYSALNRPWVGPASSWRQSQRNRRLDIMRIVMLLLLGLSIVFSFAVAVGNSQLFAAMRRSHAHIEKRPGYFTVDQGSTALALHWLAFVSTVGFFVGVFTSHIEIGAVKVKVSPLATLITFDVANALKGHTRRHCRYDGRTTIRCCRWDHRKGLPASGRRAYGYQSHITGSASSCSGRSARRLCWCWWCCWQGWCRHERPWTWWCERQRPGNVGVGCTGRKSLGTGKIIGMGIVLFKWNNLSLHLQHHSNL